SGPVDVTFDSVEIHASTTSRTSASLSHFLSGNIGSDESVSRMPAPLRLTSSYTADGPNAFSLTFPLDRPFYYDPKAGNLLFDITVDKGPRNMNNLDLSDPVGGEGLALAQEGSQGDPYRYAPITQFSYQSIPEPSAFLLLGIGGLALFLWRFLTT